MRIAASKRPEIETIASHDGTSCTLAWWKNDLIAPNRPPASIQIYNTVLPPAGTDQAQLEQGRLEQARSLLKSMQDHSQALGPRERLDIYHLAMDASVVEQERITRCISHQRLEIANRESRMDLHMMQWHWGSLFYKRFIIVIDKEIKDWEEAEMLFVFFDPVERDEEETAEVGPRPRLEVKRVKGSQNLDSAISCVRYDFCYQVALQEGEFDDDYSEENLNSWWHVLEEKEKAEKELRAKKEAERLERGGSPKPIYSGFGKNRKRIN